MATVAGSLPSKPIQRESSRQESQFRVVARRFARHRMAVISLIFIVLVLILSLLAPVIASYPRDLQDISAPVRPAPPGIAGSAGNVHLLGIDHLGRDLFTRVLYGARISLTIAIVVTLLSETLGLMIGAVAGYYRGWVDAVISRVIEFLLSVPLLPILLIVSAIMIRTDAQLPLPVMITDALSKLFLASSTETNKIIVLILILTAFGWLSAARLMRGMVLSLNEQDFVQSLKALGAGDGRIIYRHLIPNGLAPIWVDASLNIGGVIITEAALSFLALGVQDPVPTWGNMLDQARSYMFQYPWLPLIPGIPLVMVALAFNFIGDGMRDALDPRLKR
ncbi:MAG TPA: ABC transporter permease [Caldilineaceae bacterium]|nr:ABC transporter permease [Caldilineaceae bacterium]